ncbi:hypothetical protein GGR53DRAFT_523934 [Hypoxylon sp. FL1150]|nr:hypothetical protein GGR53DRAFT_523934 [Hypoxylon sp. FL1150]
MATPTPALPPPPGVTSNFDDPPSLTRGMNIAMGVAIPLATIFFGLRSYTRLFIRRTWIFEDYSSQVGVISNAAVGAATMAHYGGKHGWDITPDQAKQASYWFNVITIQYGAAICITKLALLWLYRRVFSPCPWSPFDKTIVSLGVVLILFYTATDIVKIWECAPREKIFDSKIPGSCIDTPMLLVVSGIFNTTTDFILLLLPTKAMWGAHMKLSKKLKVVLAFTFGLCAPAFSLVGTVVRIQGSTNPDKTWVEPQIIVWGLAELTAGLLCVCFPETWLLFKRKRRPGPSSSIINGNYRRETTVYQGQGTHGISTMITRNIMKTENDPYIELDEVETYNPGAYGISAQQGEVTVTREVRVDSSEAV